tara:strand:+ start:154 stop:480 length:327 start_codon:yes stop_codon:yes gene_type:complete
MMKKSEIINKVHSFLILYFLFGWIFESQRQYLVLLLPSLQYQFLMNNNDCLLTQYENKLLKEEKNDKIMESFVETKLKQLNITVSSRIRESIIHTAVFSSFLLSYYLM